MSRTAAVNEWFARVSRSLAYDRLMRLPILVLNAYFIGREAGHLGDYLIEHPAWGADAAYVLLNTASRLALLSFFALLFLFHLTRRRPVAKSVGLMPRLAAFLGVVLVFGWTLLPRAAMHPYFDPLALVLILFGNLLSIMAVSHLGRSLSVMPEARKLVTSGPYALVRHPLYVAEAISLLGVFLGFRSWQGFALLAAILAMQLSRLRYEETVLRATFPEYRDYAERVPRLLPRLDRLSLALRRWPRLLLANAGALALVLGLAWALLAGFGGQLHFPVIRVEQGGVEFVVLKPPKGSAAACQQALGEFAGEFAQRCPGCAPPAARCDRQASTENSAILLDLPAARVYLRTSGDRIVVPGASPAAALELCQAMLRSLPVQPGREPSRCVPPALP